MRLLLTAVVVTLFSVGSSRAGGGDAVVIRFVTRGTEPYRSQTAGTLTVRGDEWRIDFDPDGSVRAFDTIVRGTGQVPMALNHELKTRFRLGSVYRPLIRGHLFDFRLDLNDVPVPSKIQVTSKESGSCTSSAGEASGRDITIRYRFTSRAGSDTIKGTVWGTLHACTSAQGALLSALEADESLRTGMEAVDSELRRELDKLADPLTGYELQISRQLDGGPALSESLVFQASAPKPASVDNKVFEVPAAYVYQEPVFGGPH